MIEDITDRPIWVDLKGKDPHPLGLSEDAGDNDSYKRRCCCSYGVARYYVYIYIYICFEWVFSCENANVLVETSSGCTSQADSRIVDLSLLPHNGRLGGLSAWDSTSRCSLHWSVRPTGAFRGVFGTYGLKLFLLYVKRVVAKLR